MFCLNSLIWKQIQYFVSMHFILFRTSICQEGEKRIFLFFKHGLLVILLSPHHSHPHLPIEARELARRLSSLHEARVSAHGGRVWTCTHRGVSSTPTGRGGSNRSGDWLGETLRLSVRESSPAASSDIAELDARVSFIARKD